MAVATANFILLTPSRESGDVCTHGRHAQTDLVGGHQAVPIAAPKTEVGSITERLVAFQRYWGKLMASLRPFEAPHEKAYSDSGDSCASGFA
jgi:hypothetical protein